MIDSDWKIHDAPHLKNIVPLDLSLSLRAGPKYKAELHQLREQMSGYHSVTLDSVTDALASQYNHE